MAKLTAEDILAIIRSSFDRARREALADSLADAHNWTNVWMRSAFEQMVRADKAEHELARARVENQRLSEYVEACRKVAAARKRCAAAGRALDTATADDIAAAEERTVAMRELRFANERQIREQDHREQA